MPYWFTYVIFVLLNIATAVLVERLAWLAWRRLGKKLVIPALAVLLLLCAVNRMLIRLWVLLGVFFAVVGLADRAFLYCLRRFRARVVLPVVLVGAALFFGLTMRPTIEGVMQTGLPEGARVVDYRWMAPTQRVYAKVRVGEEGFEALKEAYDGEYGEGETPREYFEGLAQRRIVNERTLAYAGVEECLLVRRLYGAVSWPPVSAATGSADVILVRQSDGECYLYVIR